LIPEVKLSALKETVSVELPELERAREKSLEILNSIKDSNAKSFMNFIKIFSTVSTCILTRYEQVVRYYYKQ
jgi:hypothetical protein